MRISDWSSDVCSSDLVARRVGAQGVLDTVAELPCDLLGNVDRVLGHEIDTDALGTDQPYHLLDLLLERLGGVLEQEVRLVEKEAELRLGKVADLRQLLEQFRKQPEQESSIELWARHQLVGGQTVDVAEPLLVSLPQVGDRSEEHTSELQSLMR